MTLEMQAEYFDMKSKLNFCLVHIYIILAQLKICAIRIGMIQSFSKMRFRLAYT